MSTNAINVPIAGSPRFQQDTAMAIGRIKTSLGPNGSPTFTGFTLSGLTASKPIYADANKVLASITVGSSLSFSAPTLNTIQGICTTDTPTFAGLTLTAFSGVVKATAGVLAGGGAHADLATVTANQHHNQAHVLDGADHTVSGLTTGHVLQATGATTFGFAAVPGLHDSVTLATSADVLLGLTGQALSLDTQTATYVLAGPVSGAVAAPTFRALAATDIPALAYEASGAIGTHAGLTTGIHGLAITAGQTLTVTTGGTLASGAYAAAHDSVTNSITGITLTGQALSLTAGYVMSHNDFTDTYKGYLNQSVQTGGSPTFAGLTVTDHLTFDDVGNNTRVGLVSLADNTSGTVNVAVGVSALHSNTTGVGNNAVGVSALGANIGGSSNCAFGHYAGFSLTSGSSDVFLGYSAGYRQTTLSNRLIIDNQDRGSAANENTTSLFYGVFAAAAADQTLRVNGKIGSNVDPLEGLHSSGKVRAESGFKNGVNEGISDATAGLLAGVTVSGGIVTVASHVTDNSANWDAAYTASHAAVTLGTANGLSLTGQELSLPTTATPTFAKLTANGGSGVTTIEGIRVTGSTTGRVELGVYNTEATGVGWCRVLVHSGNHACAFEAIAVNSTMTGARQPGASVVYGSGSTGLSLCAGYAAGEIRLYTGGDTTTEERARIDYTGRVLINKTSGTEKLEVNGKIRADTAFNLNGTDVISTVTGLTINNVSKLGDGGTTNYSEFEADGTLEFNGTATVFNDANVGAVNLTKPASGAPGEVNFIDEAGGDTGIATLGFAVNEKVSGAIEIPHDYKQGSDLVFHTHWQGIVAPAGGTDNVKWQLAYTVSRVAATLDAVTTIVKEVAFTTRYAVVRTDFTAITGTNFLIGDQFLFTLSRIAASADEYAGEALTATIGFHYECDTVGSRTIITK